MWIDKRQPIQHRLHFKKQVWPVSNLYWMGELLVIPSNPFYIFHFIDQSVNDLYLNIHRKWVEAHGTNESNSAGLCMEEVVVSIHPESLQFWQDPVSLKWLEIPGVKSVHFELDLAICNGSQLLVLSLIPELDCWKKEDFFSALSKCNIEVEI